MERNTLELRFVKFLVTSIGIFLLLSIVFGVISIWNESSKMISLIGSLSIFMFSVSGIFFWILMLVDAIKYKRWARSVSILIFSLFGAILYYQSFYAKSQAYLEFIKK